MRKAKPSLCDFFDGLRRAHGLSFLFIKGQSLDCPCFHFVITIFFRSWSELNVTALNMNIAC